MTEVLDPIDVDNQLVDVAITDITPAADNPRRHLGDLTELAASIKAVGIVQPLVVTGNADDATWTLVAGHRRLAAAKKAGLEYVPCVVRPQLDDAARTELMVIENLQRTDLTAIEEAGAFQALVDLGWSQRQIATRVGRNQSHISKRLTLTKLPDTAVEALDAGRLTVDAAVELTKLDVKTQEKLLGKGGTISSYAIEDAARAAAQKRQHDRIGKPYREKGLKQLGQMNWMKYEECTERVATAFYIRWDDKVTFVCEKQTTATPAESPAKPRKETAKEKRAREAHEAAVAARATAQLEQLGACKRLVDQITKTDRISYSLALAALGRALEDISADDFDAVAALVEVPPCGDGRYVEQGDVDRLFTYARISPIHAVRAAYATHLVETTATWCWWDDDALGGRADTALVLRDEGIPLTEDDEILVAATAGWKPKVTEVEFVDANDLQPGDVVEDDGSITRADDVDA